MIWNWIIAAITVGVSYSAHKKAKEAQKAAEDAAKGVLINKNSNIDFLPVIYGTRRVGGTRVFISSKDVEGGDENEYLYIALAVSEGEVESITNLKFDDIPASDPRFDNLIEYNVHLGTDTQSADPLLLEVDSWTNDHKLLGVAYIAVKLKYNQDAWNGIPDITCVVQGKKVYNPFTQVTAFTSNPALCLYDYLTNNRYGKGLPVTAIDMQSFADALFECDEYKVTPYSGGDEEKIFRCNYVLDPKEKIIDNVRDILVSCRGFLPFSNGKYSLKIDKASSSVKTFNTDNIIGGINIKSGDKENTVNRQMIKFANKDIDYQPDQASYPEASSTEEETYLDENNGELLQASEELKACTSYYIAKDYARILTLRSRNQLRVAFTTDSTGLQLSIADIITVEHPTPNWGSKLFQVEEITLNADMTANILAIEYYSSIYAYDTTTTEQNSYPTPKLPNSFIAKPPSNLRSVNTTSVSSDGSVIPSLKFNWDAPQDSFVTKYEIKYKRETAIDNFGQVTDALDTSIDQGLVTSSADETENYGTVASPATVGEDQFTSIIVNSTQFLLSGVVPDLNYNFHVRSINDLGVRSDYISLSAVIGSDTTAPGIPVNLDATGGLKEITLRWDRPLDQDYSHCEVYEGSIDNSGAATKIGIATGDTYTRTGLGYNVTKYYWLKSVDYSSNVSAFSTSSNATTLFVDTDAFSSSVNNLFSNAGSYGIEPVSSLPASGDFAGQIKFDTSATSLYRWTGSAWSDDIFSIQQASVQASSFATGIEPVSVVSSLPTASGYTGPQIVFLTTDNQLYRFVDGNFPSFTKAIQSVDLVGEIPEVNFSEDLMPPKVVSSLPSQSSEKWHGRQVFLTTDNKLYRYNGTAWTSAASASDLVGELVSTQLANNAVTTAKIATGAIMGDVIGAEAIDASKIAETAITEVKLANDAVTTAKIANESVTADIIAANAITSVKIANTAVDADKIADSAITAAKIGADAVTTAKIANDAITTDLIAASAITTTELVADAVTTAKIANDAITNDLMAADAIGATELADNAVQTAALASNAVTADIIAANAVTNVKISDTAVTTAKLGDSAITAGKIATDAVTSAKIASNAVTTAAIAASAITGTEISDSAVSTAKIDAGAITTAKINAGAVTADEISSNAITTAKISASAITTAKLAAGAVTAGEIASNAVTANKIISSAVTTDKIDANAITSGKVAADAITANAISSGSVTSAKVAANAITASKMVLAGQGSALNDDPLFTDINAWINFSGGTRVFVDDLTDFAVGRTAVTNATNNETWVNSADMIALDPAKTYRVRGMCKEGSTATGRLYLGVALFTSNGTNISGDGTQWLYDAASGVKNTDHTWIEYQAEFGHGTDNDFPATAVYMKPMVLLNHLSSNDKNVLGLTYGGNWYCQDLRIEEKSNASLIVDGAITTAKISAGAVTTSTIASDAITTAKINAGAVTATEIGALAVTAGKIQANAVTTAKINASAVTADTIASNAVTTAKIQANAITASEIASNAITTGKISADAITTAKINAGAVTASEIASNAVTAAKVSASAITADAIASNAVTTAKLNASAVTADEIASNAITSAKISANAVTTAKLNAGAVTADEISANAITSAKINASAITSAKIAANAITTAKINAGAVTAGEIAANAVTSAKIIAGAVTADEIAANAVTTAKLNAGAVTADEIAANAVTTAKLNAGAVTADEIASNAITTNKLNAGAITAAKIGADAVTAAKIAANAVTADSIAANAITSAKIAANTITAADIAANAITTTELAANSVTAGTLAAGAITANAISSGIITSDHIAAGTIQASDIGANQITAGLLAASGVITSSAQINDAVISSAKIADGAITSAKIGSAAITTAKIGDLEVDTIKIKDNAVSVAVGSYVTTAAKKLINSGNKIQNKSFTIGGVSYKTPTTTNSSSASATRATKDIGEFIINVSSANTPIFLQFQSSLLFYMSGSRSRQEITNPHILLELIRGTTVVAHFILNEFYGAYWSQYGSSSQIENDGYDMYSDATSALDEFGIVQGFNFIDLTAPSGNVTYKVRMGAVGNSLGYNNKHCFFAHKNVIFSALEMKK